MENPQVVATEAPTQTATEVFAGIPTEWSGQSPSNPLAPERRGLAKIRHEDLADLLIMNPGMSRREVAKQVGYTPEYISMITCSDAFQAIMARRKGETIDPLIKEQIEARFKAITDRSLEVLQAKLARPIDAIPDALLMKAVELGAKGVGIGGFGHAMAAPPAQISSEDRLARLAGRLESLIPDRRIGAVDAVVVGEGE